jgi:ABC-type lipoprotein release transport system permease subunit
MGKLLLVYRLGLKDLRHRSAQALLLLLAIAAGAATLTLGIALHGTTNNPYARTRAATSGPDLVATVLTGGANPAGPATTAAPGGTEGSDQADAASLAPLTSATGVAAHSGPFPVTWTVLRDGPTSTSAELEGRETTPALVDQPQVLHGSWIRPGGVVVEAGFASGVGIHVGDRLTLGATTIDVVGTAVTAAIPAYPNTCTAEGCFLANQVAKHNPGLIWATRSDISQIGGADGPDAYYLNLRLDDPATADAFAARYNNNTSPNAPYVLSWQQIRDGDAQTLARVRSVLLFGSWLLALLALASVTVLVGGRMAEQSRRVGLVKAAGGTPSLVAVVLLFEHVVVALGAAVLGLASGWLAAPLIDSPGAGLLGAAGAPSLTGTTVAAVIAFALGVAAVATLVPGIRAARQSTVVALNDGARTPRRRERAIRLTAHLPVPLLLGVRLAMRRPRRMVLNTLSIAVTTSGLVTVMTYRATAGTWLADPVMTQATTVISLMLIILAAVNAVFVSWTTALDARHTAALARALGATVHQITSGLTAAQLIPALIGALLGIPGGIVLYETLKSSGPTTLPSPLWLIAMVVGINAIIAGLSLVPSRIGIRRPVAETLQTETA